MRSGICETPKEEALKKQLEGEEISRALKEHLLKEEIAAKMAKYEKNKGPGVQLEGT